MNDIWNTQDRASGLHQLFGHLYASAEGEKSPEERVYRWVFPFNTWFSVASALTIWLAGEFIEIHNMLILRRKLFALRYFWCNVWVASILGSYRPNSGRWPRPVAIHPFSEPCAVDKLLCDVEILWNTLNTLNTLNPWVASRERVSAWTSRPAQPQ